LVGLMVSEEYKKIEMNLFFNELNENINLIDIGCSDELQMQWKSLETKMNYIGFEPNKAECERISKVPNNFHASLFLPYAVAGYTGKSNINITESYYCTSLLKPDYEWLQRFEFADFFKLKNVEEISVMTLDEIPELRGIDVDIIKCDSQGLELEILKSAKAALERAIYVETESGFHANYVGESTQADVDVFMRQNGFILFGLMERRMPLKNKFKEYARPNAQVLWCECKWLRDLISVDQKDKFQELRIDRSKALKYLLVCAVSGMYDYGLEYARIFNKHKLIDDNELKLLSEIGAWNLIDHRNLKNRSRNEHGKKLSFKSLFIRILLKNMQISQKLANALRRTSGTMTGMKFD
jgi:FkbM family methyltransferase